MDWYWILTLAVGAAALLLLCGVALRIAVGACYPKRWSLLETRALEQERTPDLLAAYDAWEKVPYVVRSPHGYDLKCYYLPVDDALRDGLRHIVVIAHGFSYTHHGSIKYAAMMKRQGFDVVLYDERFHGESGGRNCTLGFYEKDDLRAVIDDLHARLEGPLFLGTYGESMGGVTALLEQETDPRVRFVVSDCAFASADDQLAHLVRHVGFLPVRLSVRFGEWAIRLLTGADLRTVRPIDAVRNARCPILFVHGGADRYIPAAAARRLFEACGGIKELYIAGNEARHAESYRKNRSAYEDVLFRFLTEKVLTR